MLSLLSSSFYSRRASKIVSSDAPSVKEHADKTVTVVKKKAPPPLHSVALVVALAAIFGATFPSLDEIDKEATIDTFTHRIFPEILPLRAMAWIRGLFALLVFSVTIWASFYDKGWLQASHYLPNSRLQSDVKIPMKGFRTQLAFTSWSWNLLGLSFALSSTVAFMVLYDVDVPSWLLRVALLSFETAAPCALLVSTVVRYAIWPQLKRSGVDTAPIKTTQMLLWHNANVVMVLAETGLLGGLPVKLTHFSVAPCFGVLYILFSWYMIDKWTPTEGPQFIYFFLDTTLGYMTSVIVMLLVLVFVSFYAMFGLLDYMSSHFQGGPVVHALAVLATSSVVCRFRD